MTKIITLHSFRGGTGKTNIVANIGALFALAGNRVGILDCDFQSPGQYFLFGLESRQLHGKNLEEYLLKKNSLKDVIYDMTSLLIQGKLPENSKSRLYLIPSSEQSARISSLLQKTYDLNALNEAIRHISRSLNLDYLLIDTHSSLAGETLLPIAISDSLLVLLRPDRQDYQATSVSIDVARRLDVPDIRLILNFMLPIFEADKVKEQVEQVMGCPVIGSIPFSIELIAMGNSGIFSLHYPDHDWTNAVFSIINAIK